MNVYTKTGDQGTVPIVGSGTGGSRPSGYWKFCVCCKYLEETKKRTFKRP